jgi:4a-hydroxytetrahydrobiopterin dehydratase
MRCGIATTPHHHILKRQNETHPENLSADEIAQRLAALPAWSLNDGKLYREFRFTDFSAAFGFMTRCALLAEKIDHHPEWSNVYNRVKAALTTHSANGITVLDFQMTEATYTSIKSDRKNAGNSELTQRLRYAADCCG